MSNKDKQKWVSSSQNWCVMRLHSNATKRNVDLLWLCICRDCIKRRNMSGYGMKYHLVYSTIEISKFVALGSHMYSVHIKSNPNHYSFFNVSLCFACTIQAPIFSPQYRSRILFTNIYGYSLALWVCDETCLQECFWLIRRICFCFWCAAVCIKHYTLHTPIKEKKTKSKMISKNWLW